MKSLTFTKKKKKKDITWLGKSDLWPFNACHSSLFLTAFPVYLKLYYQNKTMKNAPQKCPQVI